MGEVCWRCQECNRHEKAVQQRRNLKIVGMLRTQSRELPTHLNQIDGLMMRLLFQMKTRVRG